MEQDHYVHTKLSMEDRDPIAYDRLQRFVKFCEERGTLSCFQVFQAGADYVNGKGHDGSNRDQGEGSGRLQSE